jgi:predicted RNase H-like HicB family nuclease
MAAKYPVDLFWSEADGARVADVPDLGSCSAFGDTPAEALAEVEKAMEAWLAVAREDALSIPEPRDHASRRSDSG